MFPRTKIIQEKATTDCSLIFVSPDKNRDSTALVRFIYESPIVGELLKQMAEIAGKSQEKFGKRHGLLIALPFKG